MKSGKITYYIEIPIEVHYTCYKAERQTKDYPGSDAHCVVYCYGYPNNTAMQNIVDKEADKIKELCVQDASN